MNNLLTQENINLICTAVIVPLIIVMGKYIISFIELKTKQLTESIKNEKLKKYLGVAEDAIKTAVLAVGQIYVDTFKKENAFTVDEQNNAFMLAKQKALSIMGEKTIEVLNEELSIGEVDLWIESKIEQYVKTSK